MSAPDKKGTHITSLNFLRGIAAIGVCLFHLFCNDALNSFPTWKAVSYYGYLGLDVFFILSSFVIPYSMWVSRYEIKQYWNYLAKRIVRIEIPYVASMFIFLAIRWYNHVFLNWTFTFHWQQFFAHFFFLQTFVGYTHYIIIYWTLVIEIQFYILMGLLFPVMMNGSKWVRRALFLLAAVACYVEALPPNQFVFEYGLLFLTGILLFSYKIGQSDLKTTLAGMSILLVGLASKNGIDVAVVAALTAVAIFTIKKQWAITDFLGKISFSLFLTHMVFSSWFVVLTHSTFNNLLLERVLSLGVCLIVATGFHYAFEKPALKLAGKIGTGK